MQHILEVWRIPLGGLHFANSSFHFCQSEPTKQTYKDPLATYIKYLVIHYLSKQLG